MNEIVIFGAGGHAREVAQIVRDINAQTPARWSLLGFIADAIVPEVPSQALPLPLLGGIEWLVLHPKVHVVIAIGDPVARQAVAQRLVQQQAGLQFATLVHPNAWLADHVTLGKGSVVFARVGINVNASVGQHASINLGCTISHDCVLADFVSLGPGVHMAGGCTVGEGSDIGTAVSMRPRSRVGAHCFVGAGAAVVHNLPDGCKAVGVPARVYAT